MLSSVTTSISYADVNSVRLNAGEPAPFAGTLYNFEADAEINLALEENYEYELALMEAVGKKNAYMVWAIGATATTILFAIISLQ
jgi:hypothetical protein